MFQQKLAAGDKIKRTVTLNKMTDFWLLSVVENIWYIYVSKQLNEICNKDLVAELLHIMSFNLVVVISKVKGFLSV